MAEPLATLIEETRALWSKRAGRDISFEDTRQLPVNASGLFSVPLKWDAIGRRSSVKLNESAPAVDVSHEH